MQLMTKELKKRFAQVGSQRGVKDPVIVAKYFTTDGALWYATEYEPDRKTFFGYVFMFDDEKANWEYFSLENLEFFTGPWGAEVERELYWHRKKASTVIH